MIKSYEQKRIRTGKTRKDRESGATARTHANREKRAAWSNESNQTRSVKGFPTETCNGRKNRSVKVVKKNGRVAKTV